MALSTLAIPMMPNLGFFDYIDFIFSLFTTFGLYGFAYYRASISLVFWRYFFYAASLEFIVIALVFPLSNIPVYGENTQFDYLFILGCVYAFAMLYAIYHYAYRRPFIWNQNEV